jgi:hypothetical protein
MKVLARQRVTVASIGAGASLAAAGVLAMLALTVGVAGWPSLGAPERDTLVLPSPAAGDRPRPVASAPAAGRAHAAASHAASRSPSGAPGGAGVRGRRESGRAVGRRSRPGRPGAALLPDPPHRAVDDRRRGAGHAVGKGIEGAARKVGGAVVDGSFALPPPVAEPVAAAGHAVFGAGVAVGKAAERPRGVVDKAVERRGFVGRRAPQRPAGPVGKAAQRPAGVVGEAAEQPAAVVGEAAQRPAGVVGKAQRPGGAGLVP